MNNYINVDGSISNKPSVSYRTDSDRVVYSKDLRFTSDKTEAKPGDIVLADGNGVYFVSPEYYKLRQLIQPTSVLRVTAGIVVVPASHTTDGTVRIMSIKYMDFNNPAAGSVNPVGMLFGYANTDGFYSQYATLADVDSNEARDFSYPATNSHRFVKLENINDPGTHWNEWAAVDSGYGPSPYNADGTKSEAYHLEGQGFCDMDGKTNTDRLISGYSNTGWQTGSIKNITNTGSSDQPFTYNPAACCCRRYWANNDTNFNAGNWYLPSIGELGYLCARFEEIDRSRRIVGAPSMLSNSMYLPSSTLAYAYDPESGRTNIWNLSLHDFSIFAKPKDDQYDGVIAFCSY